MQPPYYILDYLKFESCAEGCCSRPRKNAEFYGINRDLGSLIITGPITQLSSIYTPQWGMSSTPFWLSFLTNIALTTHPCTFSNPTTSPIDHRFTPNIHSRSSNYSEPSCCSIRASFALSTSRMLSPFRQTYWTAILLFLHRHRWHLSVFWYIRMWKGSSS